MLTVILIIAVVVVGFVIFVATRPADFRIVRSATMAAPAAAVFAELNDFHQWKAWSPWARMDLTAKNEYEGPASGQGAIFRWSGNKQVGEGNMTILESQPPQRLLIAIVFLKPFPGNNTVEFILQPSGNQTLVTWNMWGKNNFMAKFFGLIVNVDKMVGGQFEQGLANLKSVVETKAN